MRLTMIMVAVCLLHAGIRAQSFNYTDFSSITGQMTLNGSAAQQGTVLRLTANTSNQTAGAWRSTAFLVGAGFDTTFHFRITPPAVGTKAEGMAFVIHNAAAGANALGGAVWGIGYGPGSNGAALANSLAVELDTFQDGFLSDTSSNEVTIHTKGTAANDENESASIGRTTPAANLSNGQIHAMRIRYVPGTIEVYADNLTTPVLTVPYNFQSGGTLLTGQAVGGLNLANGAAFIGFTATTGAGTLTELVEILDWSWASTPAVPDSYIGNVQAAIGTPANVLTVDGSSGGFLRKVQIPTFQPFTMQMAQPTATGGSSPFILFATLGRPDGSLSTVLPFGIGETCFPVTNPLATDVAVIVDGFATGMPTVTAGGFAPWSQTFGSVLQSPMSFTMQGVIYDTTAPSGLAVTNALTVESFVAPAPTINTLTPNSAIGGAPVTITGQNFRAGLTVAVNGVAIPVTSATATTILFPYPAGTPCGSTVTVTNLDGQFATRPFNPQPTFTTSPNASGPAAGGASYVIVGTGFAAGTTVTIGGNPATVNSVSSGVIVTTTPPGTIGPKTVVITTPGGCSVNATYTYF